MSGIQLGEKDRAFVDGKVQAGEYKTAEEVLSAALQSLAREEDRVRQLVKDADAQVADGNYMTFKDSTALADSVIDRGMRILNRRS